MAKQNKKKSKNLLKYLIGGFLVLIIFLFIGKSQGWIGKAKQTEVELAKAKRLTIVEKVSASGTVQPVIEIKLAPEVSGEIISLEAEDGDSVDKGQLLVKIRPDTWLSQLERMQASLSQQKANLESAKANLSRSQAQFTRVEKEYERQNQLWDQKVISEADWQLAKQNYEVSKNDLEANKQGVVAAKFVVNSTDAAVREASENVRKTSVIAPLTGIVTKLNVKKGERVVGTATMGGTEMLRIAELNNMEVRVNVNENDIVRVHLGDSVDIDVDAYHNSGKQFKGVVANIANTAKDKVSTDAITEFEVRINILRSSYDSLVQNGNKYPFRPGMTASVDIRTNRKENILSVPLSAVTTRNPNDSINSDNKPETKNEDEQTNRAVTENKSKEINKDLVVVFVNDNGKAKMVEVKTGISDYDNIEIISELPDSVEIVTGPFLAVSKKLKNGDPIKELEKKEEKK